MIIREAIPHRLFGRKTLCIGLAQIVAALGTGFSRAPISGMRLVAGGVGLPVFDILIELGKVHRSVSDCATCIQPQPAHGECGTTAGGMRDLVIPAVSYLRDERLDGPRIRKDPE